jgi:hypothetical protein
MSLEINNIDKSLWFMLFSLKKKQRLGQRKKEHWLIYRYVRWGKPEYRGSIRDAIIGCFSWPDPSDRTMAWGLFSLSHKRVPGIFLVVKRGRCIRLTTLPRFLSRSSAKFGNLDVSQHYEPAGSGTEIALYMYEYILTINVLKCSLKIP